MKNALLYLAVLSMACAHTASTTKDVAADGKVYVYASDASGFDTKTIFYDTGSEVVAFDTQFTPELAEKAIQFLRTKTQNPIRYAVITHPNPDKFNGASVFKKAGATIVSSKATADAIPGVHAYKKYYFVNIAKMFTDATYPTPIAVDETFTGSRTLDVTGGAITLQELAQPGVSTTQTVALLPNDLGLVVGDLVHHQAHAWLEGGIVNGAPKVTLDGWKADLVELSQRFGASNPIVYGGRGLDVALNVAIPAQIAYLDKADRIVSDYVASLGAAKPDYNALQAIFAKEFPNYSLAYMIGYGVYGLVNAKS